MTALSNSLPGWSKRRGANSEESKEGEMPAARADEGGAPASGPASGEGASGGAVSAGAMSGGTTASVTTGGGSSQEPVVVWEAANLMEAQVVKGRLESEGIPAFVRTEALGVIYGLTAGGLARADVLVPGPLAEQAFELLYEEDEESEDDQA